MMTDLIYRLIYPEHLLSVPIVNQLIRRYDLTVNILRAQIGSDDRWMDVMLTGDPLVIDAAIAWLTSQGIQVSSVIDR
jgi:ABC-type methionine transport system ATPase subunit